LNCEVQAIVHGFRKVRRCAAAHPHNTGSAG
jgi:hypothetical protein